MTTNPSPAARERAREIVRVEQRTERDCLRCCLAMVTTVDYEDVPDFVTDHGEAWPTACESWLSELGMGLLVMPTAPMWTPPWLPIIARGPTELSDAHHFVVVTPEQVVDPHPLQRGLKEVAATYAVVNSGKLANDLISHLAAKYSATCSELSAKDAEIERLTRWQDLCFELLSITRQWTAPGSITDLEAPRALRALLAERAEIRTTARADAVRECVAAARCGLNASSSGSADYISGFANGVLSGNQQTVTALESLLNKKDSNANS